MSLQTPPYTATGMSQMAVPAWLADCCYSTPTPPSTCPGDGVSYMQVDLSYSDGSGGSYNTRDNPDVFTFTGNNVKLAFSLYVPIFFFTCNEDGTWSAYALDASVPDGTIQIWPYDPPNWEPLKAPSNASGTVFTGTIQGVTSFNPGMTCTATLSWIP